MKKNAQWENWVNIVLGIGIFLIPWLMTSSLPSIGTITAIWNFWIVGALIAIIASLAVLNLKLWEEWTNVIAGAWLFFSPWVFGYAKAGSQLLWISLAVGLAVVVLSGIAVPIARRISYNNVF